VSKPLPIIMGMAMVVLALPMAALAAPPLERVIVVLEESPAPASQVAQEIARAQGGTVGFVYQHALRGFSLTIPAAAVEGIRNNPQVAYVEPDLEVFATGTQPVPTGIDRIDADVNPPGGSLSGVDIAIIDTGVFIGHDDLNLRYVTDCTGAILYPMFGGCSATGNHQDENGHGTHVAGIAAALDNDIGSIGTAPGATLWSLKALDANGSGFLGSILAAIDLVAANSASIEVANMSFGFEGSAQSLDDALTNVVGRGVVFVAAAGNSAIDASGFSPASHPDVITVSALADFDGLAGGLGAPTCRSDVDDTFADFSNFGAPVDLAAPGVCIFSTYLNDGYAVLSGTSMATPFVTGAVARLIAQGYPKPTNRAGVLALRDALVNAGSTQTSACGFSGDPDASHEPLLFLNSALFGGNGTCGGPPLPPPPNQAPDAEFDWTCQGLDCIFTDGSSDSDGTVTAWSWEFGDGSTSSAQNPAHAYPAAGTYTVGLTVTDDDGETSTASHAVTVSEPAANQPPVAGFSAACTDLACNFTDTSTDPDGAVTAWSWNFGDGSTSTSQNPSHTYGAPGTYTVSLSVSDGTDSGQTSQSVTVTAPPAEPLMTAVVAPVLVDGRSASIAITVIDAGGNGVAGATVQGQWTYLDRRGRARTVLEQGVTDSNGDVVFTEVFPRNSTVQSFCLTNVTKSGWVYQPPPITCGIPLD
jgi:PKD repeat protein